MSGQDFVMIEQCYDAMHAHIVRGLLESNDIPCILVGESHNRVEPHLSIGLGGIRVMVREQDIEIARDLLNVTPAESEEMKPKAFLQKPYWKSLILGFAGLFMGAPVSRAKGKHEE